MSLVKSPRMTEKKLAAIRRAQKLSHGATTGEGRERIRSVHVRHGFYAHAEEVALRALGEEPAQFQELLEGLWQKWNPADAFQEKLVVRLARAMWKLDRSDRMQEGYALRQAKEVNLGREDRLHAHMMRLKMSTDSLRLLARSVAQKYYITTATDLELMTNLHREGETREMGEIALALFYRLQGPREQGEQTSPADREAQIQHVLVKVRQIFGLSTPAAAPEPETAQDSPPAEAPLPAALDACEPQPPGGFTAEEWEAREPVRQLLEHILARQAEICEAQRSSLLKESLAGPSPFERAAEIAPAHRNAVLIRRIEDSCFRQVARLTSLLMKMKRHERQMQAFEEAAVCEDVSENKEVGSGAL